MVLMTMIARVVDGLPLAATMQEDEQVITDIILSPRKRVYNLPKRPNISCPALENKPKTCL